MATRAYHMNMLNATNVTATILYTDDQGEVHQWFNKDNPTTVIDEAQIAATGTEYVSGFFTIAFPGEQLRCEFAFNATDYPTFKTRRMPGQTNPNNYDIQILNGPKVQGLTAEVSFQVYDPSK